MPLPPTWESDPGKEQKDRDETCRISRSSIFQCFAGQTQTQASFPYLFLSYLPFFFLFCGNSVVFRRYYAATAAGYRLFSNS